MLLTHPRGTGPRSQRLQRPVINTREAAESWRTKRELLISRSDGTPESGDGLSAWGLRLTPIVTAEGLELTLAGRLPAAAAGRLSSVLQGAVDGGCRRISLRLEGLDYMSSAGIAALRATADALARSGGALTLDNPQPAVKVALDLAGWRFEPRGA